MEIEQLAREAGLGPLLDNSLRDGDDVWIDCDVLGGLEKFAELVVSKAKSEGPPYISARPTDS